MNKQRVHPTEKPLRVIATEAYFDIVRQQLTEQGSAFVRVTGDSMRPLLHHLRDGVTLRPPEQLRPGDVVLFDRRNGRYALHRVIRVDGESFTMMGDNQWHMEHDLPCAQVMGVVSELHRNGRRIASDGCLNKIYAQLAIHLAWPRMYGYRGVRKLLRGVKQLIRPTKRG